MKPLCVTATLLLSLLAPASGAIINVSQNAVADDVAWPALPAGSAGGTELYDARSLTIEGAAGLQVQSVRIIMDTVGSFDDSIAMDIDGDGVIDYMTTQDDAYASPGVGQGVGNYQPWLGAAPYTFDVVITAAGTTLTSAWDGVAIIPGAGSGPGDVPGFNNASGFTLVDWGFNAGGFVPAGASFTTGVMRVGNVNTANSSGHAISFGFDAIVIVDDLGNEHIFDPDSDGVPGYVPEPTTAALLMGGLALMLSSMRRRI